MFRKMLISIRLGVEELSYEEVVGISNELINNGYSFEYDSEAHEFTVETMYEDLKDNLLKILKKCDK